MCSLSHAHQTQQCAGEYSGAGYDFASSYDKNKSQPEVTERGITGDEGAIAFALIADDKCRSKLFVAPKFLNMNRTRSARMVLDHRVDEKPRSKAER